MITIAERLAQLKATGNFDDVSGIDPQMVSLEVKDLTSRSQRYKMRQKLDRERYIAVLDMETDPFDNVLQETIQPFMAVLYSDEFAPIVMWKENLDDLIEDILAAINGLEHVYTIYAHNGGNFDFMFLLKRLRGTVRFKGRSLMSAKIGKHELRDSLHIIPEKLSNWKKDAFDYAKNLKANRHKFKDQIIKYCIHDCKYALQIIKGFIKDNGMKLSIGQASLSKLQKVYTFARLGEHLDGKLRGVCTDYTDRARYGKPTGQGFFFGGRVQCLDGRGSFTGPFRLYDVNSMYPHVMSRYSHPVGSQYSFRDGQPGDDTCFIRLTCTNYGGLVSRERDGTVTAEKEDGEFFTTIHEYRAAIECNLIANVEILSCVDCDKYSNFADFIIPMYVKRQQTKAELASLAKRGITSGQEYDQVKLTDMFLKFYLNSSYGKFAQNPRKFRDRYITDVGQYPEEGEWGDDPVFESPEYNYSIWEKGKEHWNGCTGKYEREGKLRFYNVGTGASITGAARSVLLRALHRADHPIYCDTDSIICSDLGVDQSQISDTELGAWKLEKIFDEVLIVGKKQYAAKVSGLSEDHPKRIIVKNKGADNVSWDDMQRMLHDEIITKVANGPTITRYGDQQYIRRNIRATAPLTPSLFNQSKRLRA